MECSGGQCYDCADTRSMTEHEETVPVQFVLADVEPKPLLESLHVSCTKSEHRLRQLKIKCVYLLHSRNLGNIQEETETCPIYIQHTLFNSSVVFL